MQKENTKMSVEKNNMIPEDSNVKLRALTSTLWAKIGGNITAETMPLLSADEITLLAYEILRAELLQGGFVQLIQNGYGPFIFLNPFARAIREWEERLPQEEGNVNVPNDMSAVSNEALDKREEYANSQDEAETTNMTLRDFSKWLYRARKIYSRTRNLLETPTEDDDAFMALYEQVEEWDDFDDEFVEMEPQITLRVINAYLAIREQA